MQNPSGNRDKINGGKQRLKTERVKTFRSNNYNVGKLTTRGH